ncbi:MAG: hypothetical protein IJ215_04675 [Clostridia bacterium]|nr:hypothetical protein [Clostridia bacterium]
MDIHGSLLSRHLWGCHLQAGTLFDIKHRIYQGVVEMYGYFIDVILWSFSIYGLISFLKEYLLEGICYIFLQVCYVMKKMRKYFAKVAKKVK